MRPDRQTNRHTAILCAPPRGKVTIVCVCDQREDSLRGRGRDDVVDDRNWSAAHFSALNGTTQLGSKVHIPSFSVLTPPHRNASIVNLPGPGGMTPLMVASMQASGASRFCPMDGLVTQFKEATIVSDLLANDASTEDRTDFSGSFYQIFIYRAVVDIKLCPQCATDEDLLWVFIIRQYLFVIGCNGWGCFAILHMMHNRAHYVQK